MNVMDWGANSADAARNYEEYLGPAMFEPLALATAEAVEAGPGDGALDVACGTGILSRVLSARVGASGRVVGLDLGEGMLAAARSHPSPGAEIDYVQGSAQDLPYADGEFTIVTCQQGLQFFPDKAAALSEFRRVLAPAGRLGIACWGPSSEQGGFRLIGEALDRHYGSDVGDLIRSPFQLGDPAVLRQLLEEAGFGDVVVEIERVEAGFPDADHFAPRVISAGPVAGAFFAGDAARQGAVTADVAEALAPYRDGDTVGFEMPSLVAVARR
jgi:ubiquinone/menaquinone biosynthesis C-methylase UbiE